MTFKNLITIAIFSLFLMNCEKYTEGINDDPNNFIVASSDLLMGQVQLAFMQHMGSNNVRYGAIFSNQMSGGDRQYLTLNTYSPNRGNYNDMWEDTYVQGIKNAKLIENDENAGDLVIGISQIIQGVLFADLAVLYGDVPFSEAGNPEIENPVYENQRKVVEGSIAMIQSGIGKVGSASIDAGYGGNRLAGSTWAAAANTFAARYSLLAGNYNDAIAYANNGISATSDDLVTQHGTSLENRNLFYQFTVDERQDYLIAADSHLINLLDGTTERALETPANQLIWDSYFYIASGTGSAQLNVQEGGRFSQTSPMKLASYVENQLILAEAKFKTNDEAGARQHLNNVRADLRIQYGSDETGFPDSTAEGEVLLKQILEEKYITLIGELVTFHDLRRTRNFIGVPNKTTGSSGSNDFPQRFLLPQSEIDSNENVPSSLSEFFDPTELFTSY